MRTEDEASATAWPGGFAETSERLRALVGRASLAPSKRHSQPWRWVLDPDGPTVELYADESRAMRADDPGGRELVMGCGAALLTLRVAAAHALSPATVEALPDAARPALLARARLGDDLPVDARFAALDEVVPVPHRWRDEPSGGPVDEGELTSLVAEAAAEGVLLVPVPAAERPAVADLVRAADRERWSDPARREDLAHWVRPGWLHAPVQALTRLWDVGEQVGAADAERVRRAPMVALLVTPGDDRAAWLAAGQALQRVLLASAADGLLAVFSAVACARPQRRVELATLAGVPGHAQTVLRIGRPETSSRAPDEPMTTTWRDGVRPARERSSSSR